MRCVLAVEWSAYAKVAAIEDVGVDHGRAHVAMAEQLLDGGRCLGYPWPGDAIEVEQCRSFGCFFGLAPEEVKQICREAEEHHRRGQTRNVGTGRDCPPRVTESIEELDDNPEPNPSSRGLGDGADSEEEAPQAKTSEKYVEDHESGTREPRQELVEESSRRKDHVKSKGILLD